MWTVNRYAYFFRPLAEMRSGATGVFGIFPITNEFFQDLRQKKQEKYLPKYSAWIAGFSINDATKYAEDRDIGLNNYNTLVAGAWTEREKMFHGGSFLKLADDNMDIQNPEAQNRELSGF